MFTNVNSYAYKYMLIFMFTNVNIYILCLHNIITHTYIKYLDIHLSKEVKNLYAENYKTLIKETEDDSKKWIGLEDLMLLKWPYYKFNALYQNTHDFFLQN